MPASDDRTRFLQENYDLIQRWVHYNDAHLAMYRVWDPMTDPSDIPISFARFAEFDAIITKDGTV